MRAKELVVSGDKIQRFRQQHNAGIDIVQPGGMVANEDIRSLTGARVVFDFGVHAKFFKIQQAPEIAKGAVDQLWGLFDLS